MIVEINSVYIVDAKGDCMTDIELELVHSKVASSFGLDKAQEVMVKILESDTVRSWPYDDARRWAYRVANNYVPGDPRRRRRIGKLLAAESPRVSDTLQVDNLALTRTVDFDGRVLLKQVLETEDGQYVARHVLEGTTTGSAVVARARERLRGRFLR